MGSKYEVYVRSLAPSHMLTFRTLTNKVWGNYVVKEVFLCLPSCVLLSCVLYYCVCYHCVGMYPVYICIWEYNIKTHFVYIILLRPFQVSWKSYIYIYIYIYKKLESIEQPETKALIRKLERILIKLYWQSVSLLFNQTCLNERLLPNFSYFKIHDYAADTDTQKYFCSLVKRQINFNKEKKYFKYWFPYTNFENRIYIKTPL